MFTLLPDLPLALALTLLAAAHLTLAARSARRRALSPDGAPPAWPRLVRSAPFAVAVPLAAASLAWAAFAAAGAAIPEAALPETVWTARQWDGGLFGLVLGGIVVLAGQALASSALVASARRASVTPAIGGLLVVIPALVLGVGLLATRREVRLDPTHEVTVCWGRGVAWCTDLGPATGVTIETGGSSWDRYRVLLQANEPVFVAAFATEPHAAERATDISARLKALPPPPPAPAPRTG